jgi:hypothetical protein
MLSGSFSIDSKHQFGSRVSSSAAARARPIPSRLASRTRAERCFRRWRCRVRRSTRSPMRWSRAGRFRWRSGRPNLPPPRQRRSREPGDRLRDRREITGSEEVCGDQEQQPADGERSRDHDLAARRVEQRSEKQGLQKSPIARACRKLRQRGND